MKKRYRPLLPSHAIVGNTDDTIVSRALSEFFTMIGHPEATPGADMVRAKDILLDILRTEEPMGFSFPKTTDGIGGTVRLQHVENTTGFPKQITDRLVNAARKAYVSAAKDDPVVRDVILEIKNKELSKPSTIWNRFPTEVTTSEELKGFQNILYTTYYPPKKEGKTQRAVRIKPRRNILNEAITGAYEDIIEEPLVSSGKDADEDTDTTTEDPATVFAREVASTLGLGIRDDGTLTHEGTVARPSLLTVAYQTERGPLLALYPSMILPGEVDMEVVVSSEKLGRLVASSLDAPQQGDIEVIRSELKALEPPKGQTRALLDNLDKITNHLLVTRPLKPYARNTYLYAAHTSSVVGHPMKALRTLRIK